MTYQAIVLAVLGAVLFPAASAQTDHGEAISPQEIMIIFVIFIVAVIALFLYLARHSIFRKRTDYDKSEFESKKNRDYEKYHSDWQDDYEEFGSGDKEQENTSVDQDHYEVLGVPPDASAAQIKARYRELAKTHHPDISGDGSDQEMAKINEAYEVLSDKRRRAKYDDSRGDGQRQRPTRKKPD